MEYEREFIFRCEQMFTIKYREFYSFPEISTE